MKSAPLLLALLLIAGCGGGDVTNLPGNGNLTPGFYAINAQLLRPNTAARAYTGRVSVATDGTIRLFGLDPNNSKVVLTRSPGQLNTDGTNADAFLDGLGSTGELTVGVTNFLSFAGTAFSLTAEGAATALPTLGTGTTITAGTYRGELVRIGTGGAVTDWGTVTAILSVTTPNGQPQVNTLTATVVSAAGQNGTITSGLAANGTATSTTATAGVWSSDGTSFVQRLTGGDWGTGGIYFVLTRQTATP